MNNVLTVEQRVINLIAQASGIDKFNMSDDLVEGLGLDSLDLVELAINVEETFDIEIPYEAAEKWKTPADVLAYVAGLGIQ